MTSIPDNVISILRRPLPITAVTQHPTKRYLSSIKAIYAVERLNEAFGINGWKVRNELVEIHDFKRTVKDKNNLGKYIVEDATMVVIKSFLTVPEFGIEVEAYGGNDNEDRGDAYKGACTDALTKICSYIYIGMDVYKGLGTQQDADVVAQEKIKAMKNGASYESVSTPDPRKEQREPEPARPPAPGGSAAKPFNMKSSIESFEKLRELMKTKIGIIAAETIYYRVLGHHKAKHSNELRTATAARACYRDLAAAFDDAVAGSAKEPEPETDLDKAHGGDGAAMSRANNKP